VFILNTFPNYVRAMKNVAESYVKIIPRWRCLIKNEHEKAGKHRSVLKENKVIKLLLDDSWFTSTNEKKQNKRQVLVLRTFTRSSWIFLHITLQHLKSAFWACSIILFLFFEEKKPDR
jgi:hypothetical protein